METFKTQLLATLEDLCKDTGTTVATSQVTKQNDIVFTAICLVPKDSDICSIYYAEELFERHQEGHTILEIATDILRHNRHDSVVTNSSFITSFVSSLDSYDFVKNHLAVRLLNLNTNHSYLSDKVYYPYLETDESHELAICIGINVPKFGDGIGTIPVTNHLRSQWDVSDEKLLADAITNTEETCGYKIRSVLEVLTLLAEKKNTVEYVKNIINEPPMYVLTNNSFVNGAATILYKNAIKAFADEEQCNLFIIPSSIHEVLLVPDDGSLDGNYIKRMIVQVNQTEVTPCEVLSNQLLYYSRTDNRISIYTSSQGD